MLEKSACQRITADSINVSTRLGFASLPAQPGLPTASFARAADGELAVKVVSNRKLAANLVTKVFVQLQLRGNTLTAVPTELMLFGHLLRSAKIASVTGGAHVTHLPALPSGMAYQSITPENDGLHITLGGIDTTALSALPTSVGGHTVSYSARNGLLGITTRIPLLQPVAAHPQAAGAAGRGGLPVGQRRRPGGARGRQRRDRPAVLRYGQRS